MGSSMLPTLAAMVCRQMVKIGSNPVRLNASRVMGTKTMSATSLVTNMEAKKVQNTIAAMSPRELRQRLANLAAARSKTPEIMKPPEAVIRLARQAKVLKSMYSR